jgi:N-acetylneuraminic acid mutarotase
MTKIVLFVFILASLITSCSFAVQTAKASEDSWITKTPLPATGGGYGAAVVNGKIYVIGSSSNYMYDPAADSWAARNPMPTSRHSFAAVACQNKIYVIGGATGNEPVHGDAISCSLNETGVRWKQTLLMAKST